MARCAGPDVAHIPVQRSYWSGGGGREYFLFTAAYDGCLQCVKSLVEEEGVDVCATSRTKQYSALDFAQWTLDGRKNENANAVDQWKVASVAEYLRGKMGLPSAKSLASTFAEVLLRWRPGWMSTAPAQTWPTFRGSVLSAKVVVAVNIFFSRLPAMAAFPA